MKLISLSLIISLLTYSLPSEARRGGGGGGGARGGGGGRSFSGGGGGGGGARSGSFSSRGAAPSSANRDIDRKVDNRRIESRKDVNINRNVNVNTSGGYYGGWGGYYPAGAAFAWTTTAVMTAVVIGDIVDQPQAEKPSDCEQREVSGVGYVKCGEVWYKPMFNGTDVQYEVVKSPL